ncbi:MAG: hypothetical protein IPK16_07830 [Anaerolineales bacterium]|nr:hypothetical protein [Anaerolineales bacterium]
MQVSPKALLGKRTVDTLVRVWTQSGKAQWLQIHIEVQSQVDPHFAERMFVYAYRLYDRYHQLPVSIAVLGDDSPNWRPEQYITKNATSAMSLHFGMVKLLDYQARWEGLVNDSNPFALVVLAHLEAMRTDQNSLERVDAKTELMRLLGLRKYSEQETEDLLRFVDWLLQLSTAMEPLYEARVAEMKGREPMTYISTLERKAQRTTSRTQKQ